MQIRQLLRQDARGAPRPDREALLAELLGCSRSHLYAHPEQSVSTALQQAFRALLEQRRRGRPLAQLIGWREFWSLPLRVDAHTFIPRPETEQLVQQALELLPPAAPRRRPRVLDLGTGSGAIAIAIAGERPDCALTATDSCRHALAAARGNARRLRARRIRFCQGDWFGALPDCGERRSYRLIVSNPPYIAAGEGVADRPPLCFEPRQALVAAENGLQALARIIHQAPDYLAEGGQLLVEHGFAQGRAVRALLRKRGYRAIHTLRDMQGLERLSYAGYADCPGYAGALQ